MWLYSIVLFFTVINNFISGCIIQNNGKTASCTSLKDVNVYASDTWSRLTVGNFGNQTFSILKSNSFQAAPNLQSISIHELINGIESGAFSGLQHLEHIDFYNNDIPEVPTGLLVNLPLTNIMFYESGVRRLQPRCLDNLPNITRVTVKKNFITRLPAEVFNNLQIRNLILSENKIKVIDDGAFTGMNKLEFLALDGNFLGSFEPKLILGETPSLKRLWLHQNLFTTVSPDMFQGLTNLQLINLAANLIETIQDDSFRDVKNVYMLVLSYNHLETINPNAFPTHGLRNISKLYIQNNKLTFLSSGVLVRLPKLKFISLGGNPWQCPCLGHLKSWMANNGVKYPCDKEYFQGLRPACVVSIANPSDCVYDVENTRELTRFYLKGLAEYTKLPNCFL